MEINIKEKPEKPFYSAMRVKKKDTKTLFIPSSVIEKESYTNKNIPNAPDLPCIVCYIKPAAGVYTDCEHRVVCLNCAQSHFIAAMQTNQIPKCLVSSCNAPFLESSISIFHQFSQKTQQKWRTEQKREHMRKNSSSQQIFRACQFPNCEGFINPKTQKCVVCHHKHCEECSRLDHGGPCKSMTVIDGPISLKTCKFCRGKVYKEGGCSKILCPTCRILICYECGEQWSLRHHGCESGGWLRLPYYFITENCCNDEKVNRIDEIYI